MKKIFQLIFFSASLLFIGGCDKDFEEINTNPYALYSIDPQLLFAGSQRTYLGGWESESTVIQQFVNPYNLGATLAFNFNENIDGFQNGAWGQYTGIIKNYTQILNLLEGTTTSVNLQSMTRIWRAHAFMKLVDTYGDVPYFNTGRAAIDKEIAFFPEYDDDAAIYDDLYTEIKDALSKLNPAGDFVSADLFYGSRAYYPVNNVATQVTQWKKLGNSLLLRLGMRYSKLNPTKAAAIVAEAFAGGVMTSNNDNAFVVYDGTLYTNGANGNLLNNNPRYYYAAQPFVDQLKSTNDPRGKYMLARFANPNAPLTDPNPNTVLAQQYGLPVGVTTANLTVANGHRGPKGSGYDYSQLNINVAAHLTTPTPWVTYSQTSLLLAEAAFRGWIPGGNTAAQTYYENGVTADMDFYALILLKTKPQNPAVPILPSVTTAEKTAYLAQPLVAFNATDALRLINTQYWISSFLNSSEAWANYRRTGFPVLNRNAYNNALMANGGDGYVHRFTYPDEELPKNKVNYQDAIARLNGGIDDLVSRVFWDIP